MVWPGWRTRQQQYAEQTRRREKSEPPHRAETLNLRSSSPNARIRRERQQRRRHCAGQHQPIIDRRNTSKNQFAESTCAYRRGNRRNPDTRYRRRPQSRKNERSSQRQFNLEEPLRTGEPKACATSITDGSMPRMPAYVFRKIGSNAYQSVRKSQSAPRAPKPRQRQQESKHRERGNSLKDIRYADNRLRPPWRTCQPDSGRQRNHRCKRHGRRSQPHMFRRQRGNLFAVL